MTMLRLSFLVLAFAAAATASASAQTSAPAAGAPPSVMFSDIKGRDIADAGGKVIGALQDALVDGDGKVIEFVAGEGGFLGLGEKLHRVDPSALADLSQNPIPSRMTADALAALPRFERRDRDDTSADASGSPPIAGAPQQAPQNATTDIPVLPSQAPAASAALPAPLPDGGGAPPTEALNVDDTPAGMVGSAAPEDNSRASGTTTVEGEQSAAGSGSGGMVPQQGTGTGATQVRPGANENEARTAEGSTANAQPEQAQLNREYGTDQAPAQPPMQQGNAAAASAKPSGADATPSTAPGQDDSWLLGDLMGAEVEGKEDGIEISDFRLANGAVTDVVLTGSVEDMSGRFRAVDFSDLDIGGEPDDPEVALDPAADARSVSPAKTTP